MALDGDMSRSTTAALNDEEQLFAAFEGLLRSTAPITLPDDTLHGAITHYLSTLTSAQLPIFVRTLCESTSLWHRESSSNRKARQAVRLAVSSKVSVVQKETRGRYFENWRRDRILQTWLGTVSEAALQVEEGHGRNEVLQGLLSGLDDVQGMEWGSKRVRLEEEVVVSLANMLQRSSPGSVVSFCEVAPHINETRLGVLDLSALLPQVSQYLDNLLRALESNRDGDDSNGMIASASHALARVLVILDHGGPQCRSEAWTGMARISEGLREFAASDYSQPAGDQTWQQAKSALFAFLTVSSSFLDIVLDSPPSSSPIAALDPSAALATSVLLTSASYAPLIESAQADLEGYHRILLGCLDVLAAQGGVDGVRHLFKELRWYGGDQRAVGGFALVCAEQLLHLIDGRTLSEYLMPLAETLLMDVQHRPRFEAAHAFMLAVIEASSSSAQTANHQKTFLAEVLPFYSSLLVKQTIDGDISADQLRAAFPPLIDASAHLSDEHIDSVLAPLRRVSPPNTAFDSPFSHTTLLTLIACAPHIPIIRLRPFLDELPDRIMTVPSESVTRNEAVQAAFRMVVEDLPDEAKEIGVDWWAQWRDRLEGEMGRSRSEGGWLRARL